jgi:UTP--glucose-1-phosphate uridylyltransferase
MVSAVRAMPLDLDADTAALLARHRFDAALFERLRADMMAGVLSGDRNRVRGRIEPPAGSDVLMLPAAGSPEHAELARRGAEALAAGQVGCIVMAGGMATRFGGVVKAAVDVLPGRSFLSLKLADVRAAARRSAARVPVYLMSSFATHADLERMIAPEQSETAPLEVFCQFVSLRLSPDGSLFRGGDGKPSPYAPGHGDLPSALRASGALGRFLGQGGRLLVVSNVDNLAATLDPVILGAHLAAGVQMTVEAGRRQRGERGGILARVEGKLQIVEDFRLPQGFDPESAHHFNTNTFVLDARALDREFELPFYLVRKTVEGRDAVQFERLVGELSAFLSCACVEVSRDGVDARFQPVKDPEELDRRRGDIERILRARGIS